MIQAARARWRTVIVTAVIGVLGALAGQPRRTGGQGASDFFGVVPQTAVFGGDVDRMGIANVGVMRIIINWAAVDPTAADGDNDWSSVDGLMLEAARNGIELQPFIFGTPSWVAQSLDNHSCSGDKCITFAPKSKAALAAWQKFVGEAVARYGPGGTFFAENPAVPVVPIKDWQAWNEMNSKTFFAPKPKPKLYAKLLKAFRKGSSFPGPDGQRAAWRDG